MPYTRLASLKGLLRKHINEEEKGSEEYLRLANFLKSEGASKVVVEEVEKMAMDEYNHGEALKIILDGLKAGILWR